VKTEAGLRENLADYRESLRYLVDECPKETIEDRDFQLDLMKDDDKSSLHYLEYQQYRTARNIGIFVAVGILLSVIFDTDTIGIIFAFIGAFLFILSYFVVKDADKKIKRVAKERRKVHKNYNKEIKQIESERVLINKKIRKIEKKLKKRFSLA
jgi:hypothetical protein